MTRARTVGILGTGLIGGSIGLRARRQGLRSVGADRDAAALAAALEVGCIEAAVSRDDLYAQSDIVVLAAPVRAVVAELQWLDASTLQGVTLVMDVASVKVAVVQAARGLPKFVATHPMAGSEQSGARAASANLFEGKAWAFVPGEDEAANAAVLEFILALGADPEQVDAETHDAIVACTSHMPQIFAWIFAQRLRELQDTRAEMLCGPVARELLRIGENKPPFWDDVLHYNSQNVDRELLAMAGAMERYIRNTP